MPVPANREALPREVRIEHQRTHVLDAATEVFAKRGYPGTTIDHLIAAAGVGFASFYDLFEGKEDCLLRDYERIVAHFWDRIAAVVPASAPWSEQVCAALRAALAEIAAEPFAARVALIEIQTAGPPARARYEQTHDAIAPLLRRGREESPLADQLPPTLEEAIIGGVSWLLQQRLVMGEVEGIESLYAELVKIVIGPYLGEEAAGRLASADPA